MNRTPDLSTAAWRKSSYSDGGDSNCIEVADGYADLVPVRDSKTPGSRPLVFSAASWSAFVSNVRETA
ncbi:MULTISPECIES: DUF397 domain-containing protein [unclassified Streptomyces]|uniref:DUF397 domain-containing protein n=1 Tax=unclassified Streptomyces TaxID=2593676 RepID=UPI002E80BCD1|nr:DUF397 domain-containing protein [Streptomyces sp. NBC_00589]WTI38163.1 DUF397 domain-containing protein [Streptomyces sp. NBC_00775]WUB28158.1 DUF397 domain-containing protein [Streptomyces sp. NBC_00589]